jgi:hypothetical protein
VREYYSGHLRENHSGVERATEQRREPSFARWRALPLAYWMVVGIASALTLARFSEAFLLLRAKDVGLATRFVLALLVVMKIAYAVSAYPAGMLSDRIGRVSPVSLVWRS